MLASIALLAVTQGNAFDPGPDPLLMRHPTVNATTIVFQFAGDLWSVPRAGGDAIRLTASIGASNADPIFSPDGTEIAFRGDYDGNVGVFVMPATGGSPKQLTAHPTGDTPLGWTPDGKAVLFESMMLSNTDYARLFTVPITGGMPTQLPFPAGIDGCFSPDGKSVAYVPNPKWEQAWKRYRGGQTTPIWIGDLSTSKVHEIPRNNTNDFNPMWVGNSIYYLTDPTGPVGMNRFNVNTGKESVVVPGNGFDLKSASAFGNAIVYEKLGSIHLLDLDTGKDTRVPIHIAGDFPVAREDLKDIRANITSFDISPTGQRALVTARGWVFTVPAEKGDIRQLVGQQGVDRRNARWSPDGKTVAYISDENANEHLTLYDLATGTVKTLELGDPPGDYNAPVWSPDSKKIAYTDNKLNLWVIDLATGNNTKIDTGSYRDSTVITPNWSPDSKWLTWSRDLLSFVNAVFLYNFDTGKTTQITDGLADSTLPCFDRNGKYLYFIACTNVGFGMDIEDLEAMAVTNTTSNVYAVLLKKDGKNPLEPQSDDEKPATAEKPDEKKGDDTKPTPTQIDLDEIQHRIFALPLPAAGNHDIEPGPEDTLYVLSVPPRATPTDPPQPGTIQKFSFTDRKTTTFASGVNAMRISADGKKMLMKQGDTWRIVAVGDSAPEGGNLDLTDLKAKIDPRAEWTAMYHEVWRKERMLFYDPGLQGIDSVAMEKRYEPFLKNLRSRDDLNYLFTDMLGEICIGHMFIGGGDMPAQKHINVGLLGADYTFDHGHYRFTRIYDGESWNPGLTAPLAAPGINAKAGEYLLEIDGRPLTDATDIYLALEDKAGKQVRLKIGPSPDGGGARDVVVVPVASERELRFRAWEEDNRRYVEKETGGLGGYVHVPDTGAEGWSAFMRYYYSQNGKSGMIVDDRFNHGGAIDDFMVREMEKPLDFYGATRYGSMFKVPMAAVYGPKVMLINEMAGSGGDLFPYLFRAHHIGKLVGHKTWGGELSAYGFDLIDGGTVRAPDDAEFDPKTDQYVIDNVGVPPDIPVNLDPAEWRTGVDSQLEAAVEVLKKEIAETKPMIITRPPYPNKSKLPK